MEQKNIKKAAALVLTCGIFMAIARVVPVYDMDTVWAMEKISESDTERVQILQNIQQETETEKNIQSEAEDLNSGKNEPNSEIENSEPENQEQIHLGIDNSHAYQGMEQELIRQPKMLLENSSVSGRIFSAGSTEKIKMVFKNRSGVR